jgi:UPF0755 protein
MKSKIILKLSLIFITFFIFFIIGITILFFYLNRPSEKIPDEGVLFKVNTGETINSIATRLEDDGLIQSSMYLILLSKALNTESQFKFGTYNIFPGLKTTDIHRIFISGKQYDIKITFLEGITLKGIAGVLEDYGIVSKEEFLKRAENKELLNEFNIPASNFEGYLFPDTYYFALGSEPDIIIRRMVNNFFIHLGKIIPDYQSLNNESLHDYIILASIVEKEYRLSEEAPIISSVFYNRLKYGMGLESCATIAYILTDIMGESHPEIITTKDTQIDSLYNTYKWCGLPPGPISNPGQVALNATINPAETDYLYFVLKNPDTGEHYFSTNLDEHNEAKYFYLKQ